MTWLEPISTPPTMARIAGKARANGWHVVERWAEHDGHAAHVLLGTRGSEAFWASWLDFSFRSAFVTGGYKIGARELTKLVSNSSITQDTLDGTAA